MDSSEHSRNSSVDVEEHETRSRDYDDMHNRRLGGNIPGPLRKKKNEIYKQFITPTGDPMRYVRKHMRSKSMSELEDQKARKESERDERNTRYQEMQQLKVMLKEEEDTWTSNLDDWKQRRRSATLDVRKRKEDRITVQQASSASSLRRPKTYHEIVEDKKRREMEMFDENDNLSPRLHIDSDDSNANRNASRRKAYKGAISVPNVRNADFSVRSSSPGATRVVVQPVRYTSKVTALINHVPTRSEDSSDLSREETSSQRSDQNANHRFWAEDVKPKTSKSSKVGDMVATVFNQPNQTSPAQPNSTTKRANGIPFSNNNSTHPRITRSRSPPANKSYSSATTVVMRGNKTKKERPKSEYAATNRASTLPRNYHEYSAPKPFVQGTTSSFAQYRKSAFANKRNMWESMAHKAPEPHHSGPQHLSALLQHDTENLQNKPNEKETSSVSNHTSRTSGLSPRETSVDGGAVRAEKSQPRWGAVNRTEPKTVGTKYEPVIRSWQPRHNQPESKSTYTRIDAVDAAPAQPSYGLPSKSVTLPSRRRFAEVEVSPAVAQRQENLPPPPQQNGFRHNEHISSPSPKSPTSPPGDVEAKFDDMKICINQRPKSERGFGFTVRGGEDGKPVIVNAISPGGAAEICQLYIGDEILAINDVPLSSSLTQNGIVQLIVGSVFTGNLSLDIRRYGKSKKSNSLRLSGTKVVMTSGGFVQVRSDKGKAPVVSTKTVNGNSSSYVTVNYRSKSPRNVNESLYDLPLPPPPPHVDLETSKKDSAVSRLSVKKSPPHQTHQTYSNYRTASPLSNLMQAAKPSPARSQGGESHARENPSPREQLRRYSPVNDEEELENNVLRVQQELDIEEAYLSDERHKYDRDNSLRMQLLEEQRNLEEREARREEEKRKRIEDAKREEKKLEEELRRIELKKMEQQKKREAERRKLFEDQPDAGMHLKPSFDQGGVNHWLIEEAERSRMADNEGRHRMNPLDYSRGNGNVEGSLPDHMEQRYSQPRQTQRNSQKGNPHLPGSLTDYWNDPSTQATLL